MIGLSVVLGLVLAVAVIGAVAEGRRELFWLAGVALALFAAVRVLVWLEGQGVLA